MLLMLCDLPASVVSLALWPHGIPKDAHFIILVEVADHSDTLFILLYCKYGHATLLAYGFSLTIVENFECSLSLEETWMKERLFQSLCDFINLLGGCNDSQFLP